MPVRKVQCPILSILQGGMQLLVGDADFGAAAAAAAAAGALGEHFQVNRLQRLPFSGSLLFLFHHETRWTKDLQASNLRQIRRRSGIGIAKHCNNYIYIVYT